MPKTDECVAGHDLRVSSKTTKSGKRQCIECQRRRNREYARRKRVGALIAAVAV